MTNATRALLLATLTVVLSGCASNGMQSTVANQISIAPAIDVAYAEVIENVPENIGIQVRWGGQIIAIDNSEELTRLTVLAYPLNAKGQPQQEHLKNFVGGRFIVEIESSEMKNGSQFITVFGTVTDKHVLSNGKLTKVIPVVTALEAKGWSAHDQRYARQRHRLPYNGLEIGLSLGHARIGYGYYDYYGHSNLTPFFYPYPYFNTRGFRPSRHR